MRFLDRTNAVTHQLDQDSTARMSKRVWSADYTAQRSGNLNSQHPGRLSAYTWKRYPPSIALREA